MMTREEAEAMYTKSASEWLERWDNDQTVWSIEMGGLGPGYEQCIQITTAEFVRALLANGPIAWDDWDAAGKEQFRKVEDIVGATDIVKKLGLSGAQFGAAANLASMLVRNGPVGVMQDERVKDRRIQVQRTFP
jgi:hypothetical protein